MYINAKVNNKAGVAHGWADFYYYGDTDKSADVQFGYVGTSGYTQADFIDPAGVARYHNDTESKTAGSKTTYDPVELYSETLTNHTDKKEEYTLYFGFYTGSISGSSYYYTYDDWAQMSTEISVTPIDVPEVDVSSTSYDGQNHDFTFTYDSLRAGVTKMDFTDRKGVTKTTTGSPLDVNGKMTVKAAGTYKLYFDINSNCGAVWDTATDYDQDTKTVSFTINSITLNTPQGAQLTAGYNGSALTISDADNVPAWYNNLIYTDTAIMTLSPVSVTNANESGYTVTATIVSDGHIWSDLASNPSDTRTFTYKVNRQPLTIEFEDKDGLQVAKFSDESEIFSCDKDAAGKPTFTLKTKYYKDGAHPNSAIDSPTSTGNWVAMAVIDGTGASNYKVDATEAFNLTKKQVAYPTISGSASEEYDGTSQSFTFTGFDPATMNAPALPTGADSFDGTTLKVTNAGTYTPVFTLKDTTMCDWSGTAPGAVEITPKPVVINSDSANAASWEKGTATTLTFDVPTPLCGSDTTVNLVATYTLNGGDPQNGTISVSGKTGTVTIGKGFAKGNYVLTVKTADGENYSGTCTYNFEIMAHGLSLGSNDIKWTIDGNTYVANDYDDGSAVFEMEYTGKPLDLTNVSVNFSSASDAPYLEQDGDLTGTFIGAVNVDTYTATFKIKPKSSEEVCSDGPFTLTIKIVPKKLDFSKAEWEYSNDGGSTWTKITATNKPSYTGDPITVRISPDYMKSLGLDVDNGDYTETYTALSDPTEQGSKTTKVELTINNDNYTTADESGYENITYNWEITARALTYTWSGTQAVEVEGKGAFEFPAVKFADDEDYSQYYDYIYTVNGTDYTLEELKQYIAANWSDTTPVSGTVRVQLKSGVTQVNINSTSRSFTTGAPKTALTVEVSGSGAEYGKVAFVLSVTKGIADERARTTVAITGGALSEAKIFGGNDPELVAFVNGLGVGNYVITVSLKAGNEDSYVLTKSVFDFEVLVRKIIVPQVKGDITFNGEYINIVDYLDGNYNANVMSMLSGYTNKIAGSYTVTFKLNSANYMWVEPASVEPMNKLFAKALFTNEISINNPELTATLGWSIGKIVLATDSWNLKGKTGATLNALADYQNMITANSLDVAIAYRYYDTNGNLLEEPVLKGGDKYIVEAYLIGEDAANFEFADGTDELKSISARKDYTVPQSAAAAFFGSALSFAKANWLWLVIAAVVLLFLIILICIIASAKKKKRKREELAEQRRLEEKEEKKREQEERRLEREERMARMSQQQAMPQMMMPQMMQMPQMQMPQQPPQYAPQSQGQPAAAGGGTVSEAQFLQMQAELKAEISALKAEQSAKEIAALRAEVAMRDDISVLRSEGGRQMQGGMNVEAMTEIMTMALKNVLASAAPALAAQPAQPAQLTDGGAPTATPNAPTQIPPDAVMTTVTTTKIDTTKKPGQPADRAA
ncbi:MAG: hypothetical protein K2N17_04760, partial [Clostridia bacterium]|nr:hypothetical protein [Clostridia bacterium]